MCDRKSIPVFFCSAVQHKGLLLVFGSNNNQNKNTTDKATGGWRVEFSRNRGNAGRTCTTGEAMAVTQAEPAQHAYFGCNAGRTCATHPDWL